MLYWTVLSLLSVASLIALFGYAVMTGANAVLAEMLFYNLVVLTGLASTSGQDRKSTSQMDAPVGDRRVDRFNRPGR